MCSMHHRSIAASALAVAPLARAVKMRTSLPSDSQTCTRPTIAGIGSPICSEPFHSSLLARVAARSTPIHPSVACDTVPPLPIALCALARPLFFLNLFLGRRCDHFVEREPELTHRVHEVIVRRAREVRHLLLHRRPPVCGVVVTHASRLVPRLD